MKKIIIVITTLLIFAMFFFSDEKPEATQEVITNTSNQPALPVKYSVPLKTPQEIKSTVVHSKAIKQPKNMSSEVRKNGRLGDSLATFESVYGINEGTASNGVFRNGLISTNFIDNKAWNISIQSATTPKSKTDFLLEINNMIPSDASLVEEYIDPNDNDREIITYKSITLADAFSKEMFMGDEPGSFIVVIRKSNSGYTNATIALGNTP